MAEIPRVAVSVIPVKGGKVLVGRRADGHGHWECPGGKLEWGEDPADCARRELAEETGLTAVNLTKVGFVSVEHLGVHWVVLFYQAAVDGEPQLVEPDKNLGWQWADWDNLPQPLLPGTAALVAGGFRPAL